MAVHIWDPSTRAAEEAGLPRAGDQLGQHADTPTQKPQRNTKASASPSHTSLVSRTGGKDWKQVHHEADPKMLKPFTSSPTITPLSSAL